MTSASNPSTDKHKIPFGLRDGQMAHVQDVAHGKKCGCVCAECRRPLIASNREPRKVAKYFRHDTGAECPGGYETAIHRAAKEVLLRRGEVILPACNRRLSLTASDGLSFTEVVTLPSKLVVAEAAYEEVWQENMRPDVVYTINGQSLYIEIRVTHAVDEQKKQKIRAKACSAIEIDLGQLGLSEVFNMKSFEKKVCHDLENRIWVYRPEFEHMTEEAMKRLREMRDAHEQKLAEIEERRRQREAAKQERMRKEAEDKAKAIAAQAATDARRKSHLRHQYTDVLARLHEFQDERRIAEWDGYLQGFKLYQSPQSGTLAGAEFLLCKVGGFWIFNARYQDWQAYILDLLFPPAPLGRQVSIGGLKQAVLEKFTVIPWVETINELEFARKRKPSSDKGFVLNTMEVGVVPDPYKVISHYIAHLSSLQLVGQKLEWVDGNRSINLHSALDRFRQRLEAKRQREELEQFAARMRSEKERAEMARKRKHILDASRELEYAIRASELQVYRKHGGGGLRCGSCYFLNPSTVSCCQYCRIPSLLKPFSVDSDYLSTSKYRLRTSPEFNRVLSNQPALNLDDLANLIAEVKSSEPEGSEEGSAT